MSKRGEAPSPPDGQAPEERGLRKSLALLKLSREEHRDAGHHEDHAGHHQHPETDAGGVHRERDGQQPQHVTDDQPAYRGNDIRAQNRLRS